MPISEESSVRSFTTRSTSYHPALVSEPIVLSETTTTRRVAIAAINDAKTATHETVSLVIVHQRKGNRGVWEPVESLNLSTLRSGDGVKLNLNSEQTRRLYDGLLGLY